MQAIKFFEKVKPRRMLAYVLGFMVTGIATVLLYRGNMNYRGYCWEDQSYLTDQEKIHRAVQDILEHYPPAAIPVERCETNCSGGGRERIIPLEELPQKKHYGITPPEHPVLYNGIDQFFLENANCCELRQDQQWNPSSPEFGVPSFLDRVTGREVNYIRVRYWVKYLQNGDEEKILVNHYAGLSTCAKPSWRNVIPLYLQERNK